LAPGAASLVALAALLACSPEAPPRLVLLYATCTLGVGHLAPYRPNVHFTPHLEEFARSAAVFTRHQTEAPQSAIAFASLFSGSQSDHHGVYSIPQRLPDDPVLISEAFRGGGYEVFAWLEHLAASGRLNYGQGATQVLDTLLTADDATFRSVLDRLSRDADYRALLLTAFTVTHGPYSEAGVADFCAAHPEECEARQDRAEFRRLVELHHEYNLPLSFDFPATLERLDLPEAEIDRLAAVARLLYRANVFRLDALFGALLERIEDAGLLDEAVVVFTADHGELLYRENAVFQWSHSHQLNREVLHVPLLIHGPGAGVRPGAYDFVTRSIDVFPTLAGLAGLGVPEGVSGHDLSGVLRGRADPPELLAFSHTAVLSPSVEKFSRDWGRFRQIVPRIDPRLMWVGVRSKDLFYLSRSLDGSSFETVVRDWASDPAQEHDLFDPANPEHQRMVRELADYKARLVAAYRDRKLPDPVHEAELLEALGYIER
jgi:arylsulfatase A-like enzyme